MGNVIGEPLKFSICEKEERNLRDFLTKKNHKDCESMHFVVLDGDSLSVRITFIDLPFADTPVQVFLLEGRYIDEFGNMKSFIPVRQLNKRKTVLRLSKISFHRVE